MSEELLMYSHRAVVPGRNWDLSESSEQHSRGEADKGHNGPLQEVQLSHQHIGGLCTLWDLLHKVQVHLVRQSKSEYRLSCVLCRCALQSWSDGFCCCGMCFGQMEFHYCFLGGTMWPSWQHDNHSLQILAERCIYMQSTGVQPKKRFVPAVFRCFTWMKCTLFLKSSQHPIKNETTTQLCQKTHMFHSLFVYLAEVHLSNILPGTVLNWFCSWRRLGGCGWACWTVRVWVCMCICVHVCLFETEIQSRYIYLLACQVKSEKKTQKHYNDSKALLPIHCPFS